MFSGIEFYLFPRGKLSIFRFRLGSFFVTLGSLLFKHTNWCIATCLLLSRLSLKSPSSFLSLVLLNNILVEIMSYWTSMTAKYCHSDVSLDQCSISSFRTSFRQMATSEHVHGI
jgi:hypothetical protein